MLMNEMLYNLKLVVVSIIENGKEICIRVCSGVFIFFHS